MTSRAKYEADYIPDFSRPENTHFRNILFQSLPHLKAVTLVLNFAEK